MFKAGFDESTQSLIRIRGDIETGVFQAVLKFFYSQEQKFIINEGNMCQLRYASELDPYSICRKRQELAK